MKPRLVIGLGNPLMGDDGIGCLVAERLAADPRLPGDTEAIAGGTDLLRLASQMTERREVVVLDAVQDGLDCGTVSVLDRGLEERQDHAHHLSAAQAMALLRLIVSAELRLLGISIASAKAEDGLSPALSARLPEIVDRVIEELR